jgi:hypothetical protein
MPPANRYLRELLLAGRHAKDASLLVQLFVVSLAVSNHDDVAWVPHSLSRHLSEAFVVWPNVKAAYKDRSVVASARVAHELVLPNCDRILLIKRCSS